MNDEKGFRITHSPFPIRESKGLQQAAADYDALPETHPDRAYGKALLAFTCGNPTHARDALARIVEERPYLVEARLVLAIVELVAGTPKEAERHASRVYALGDRTAWVCGTLAFARAMDGRWEEAVKDAAEALARDPAWSSMRNCRGIWLQRLQRLPEALAELDRLIQEAPQNFDYRLNRSRLRLRLGNRMEALEDADEACRRAPNDPRGHVVRGHALEDPEQAIAAYSRALALDGAIPEAYLMRAAIYDRLHRTGLARQDYQRAVDLEPDNVESRFLLALSHWKAHELLEAEHQFGEVIVRKGDKADAYFYRGVARVFINRPLEGNKDVREAERIATEAIEAGKGDASAFGTRAYARAFQLRPKEALTDAAAALALRPLWPELHYDRGTWLIETPRPAEAVEEFYAAGRQYLAAKDPKEAAASFEQVLALNPDDAGAHAGRGQARFALQDFRGALEDMQEAVRLRDSFQAELKEMIEECKKRVQE